MNPELLIFVLLIVAAGIFFIYGAVNSAVRHSAIGGILLTIAILLMILYGIKI